MNDLIKVLLSGAACAALGQPALAQRASENAVANADDAFGSNVGLETTGIYSDQDTRGFSPVKAGNARIDGIYYDPVGSISGRMRMGTAIRVGFASEEYPFHAPTGIADYRFRPFPDADGLSLSHTTMAFGGVIQEADLRLALDPGRIGFTGGVARADLKMSDGSRNASWGYAFRPFFRFGGMEFAPFTSGANFYSNYAHPLIVVRGSDLPDLPRKRRFLGQKWAEGSYRNRLHGATLRGNITDRLSLRAGLFRAEGPRQQNYAELFGYTSDAQPLSHRVVSDPVQDIHSTSGEALLAWRVGGGRIDSRVFAGFRGRNRLTETGGSGVADLAPFTGWNVAQVARPLGAGRRALAEVVHQAGPAHRKGGLQARALLEHQQLVLTGVDLGVVGLGLRHAPQAVQLGQQALERAAGAQHLEQSPRVRLHQALGQFLPHTLGHQGVDLALVDEAAHQRQRVRGDREVAVARGKARRAQQAHRVLGVGLADVTQHAVAQVTRAAMGVDEGAVGRARHGVDGEVAPRQVLLERDVGRGVDGEAVVAGAGLALGARERVFLVRVRVQEDGKVAPDGLEAQLQHLLRRHADDDPVPVGRGPAEQRVAHTAADLEAAALQRGGGVRGSHRAHRRPPRNHGSCAPPPWRGRGWGRGG